MTETTITAEEASQARALIEARPDLRGDFELLPHASEILEPENNGFTCGVECVSRIRTFLANNPLPAETGWVPGVISETNVGDVIRPTRTGGSWSEAQRQAAPQRVRLVNAGDSVRTEALEEGQPVYWAYATDASGDWPFERQTTVTSPVEAPTPTVEDTVTITRAEYQRLQTEATREFSQYDERMRPMFLNTARVANAAGFCSEYDRIASAVGAPSRDEFLRKTWYVEVPITLTGYVTMSVEAADEDEAREAVNNQYTTDDVFSEASVDSFEAEVDWYGRSSWDVEEGDD